MTVGHNMSHGRLGVGNLRPTGLMRLAEDFSAARKAATNQLHCGPQCEGKRVICGLLTIDCGPRMVPLLVRTVSLFIAR